MDIEQYTVKHITLEIIYATYMTTLFRFLLLSLAFIILHSYPPIPFMLVCGEQFISLQYQQPPVVLSIFIQHGF